MTQQTFRFTKGKSPPPKRPRGPSLATARREVMAHLDEGTTCPCCDQFCKEYKRKLNSGMAAGLVWLVREFLKDRDWINIPNRGPRFLLRTGGQFSVLAHWGLIVQKVNDDGDKRTSGLWKPTKKGVDFVLRKRTVPSHVYLYNNEVRGWEDAEIDIDTALGNKFSYKELMSA